MDVLHSFLDQKEGLIQIEAVRSTKCDVTLKSAQPE